MVHLCSVLVFMGNVSLRRRSPRWIVVRGQANSTPVFRPAPLRSTIMTRYATMLRLARRWMMDASGLAGPLRGSYAHRSLQ